MVHAMVRQMLTGGLLFIVLYCGIQYRWWQGKKQLVLLRIRDVLFHPGYRIHQQKRGKN
jgi:hypothetical protein